MVYGSYFHFFCTSPWPVYTLEFYVGVDFIDDLVFRRGQVLLHGNVHLITFDLPDLQKLSIFGSQ